MEVGDGVMMGMGCGREISNESKELLFQVRSIE